MEGNWIAALITVTVVAAYELRLAWARRTRSIQISRHAHATLREEWFDAISASPGSEILAVQALRNSLMSASMTASTAALALMGSLTLTAPSLRSGLGALSGTVPQFTPRLLMELAVLVLLFSSLASSVMAVRYYTHASFIGSMPVGSPARQHWSAAGCAYVSRAGVLYSWSLRNLLLIVPPVGFVIHPYAGPVMALFATAVLGWFDRGGTGGGTNGAGSKIG